MGRFSFHNALGKRALSAFMFFFVWAGVSSSVWSSTDHIEITIKKISTVTEDVLLLSCIARIHANDFLKKPIGSISLGNAPKPGEIRKFTKKRLVRMIQANPLLDHSATIICPDQVYVERTAQSLEKEMIQDQVLGVLEKRFSPRRFEILSMDIRNARPYPEGDLQLVPGSRCFIGSNGRFSLTMKVLVDKVVRDRIFVTGKIAEFDTLVCAAKDIGKNTVITAGDIYLARKNLMEIRTRGIKDKAQVIGQSLKFSVRKGQVLDPEKIIPASLVQKGDIITLVVSNPHLQIITPGISMEQGFANKPLLVKNLKSGKKIRGILRKDSTVEVLY